MEASKAAADSMTAHPLRSVLSALGIVIGVGGVIAVVSLGEGTKVKIIKEFEKVGGGAVINLQTQEWTQEGGRWYHTPPYRMITLEAAAGLAARCPHVKTHVPMGGGWKRFQRGNQSQDGQVLATSPEVVEVADFTFLTGRFFSWAEYRSRDKVAVLGYQLAKSLFPGESPLGLEVRAGDVRYEVVGVLRPQGSGEISKQMDKLFIVPFPTFSAFDEDGSRFVPQISFLAKEADSRTVELALNEIDSALTNLFGDSKSFSLSTSKKALESLDKTFLTLKLMLGGIASIALLVGGIGIMNIMLVTVTERTREIGLRKALGARKADILKQFLVESVILALVGGILGIVSGLLLGKGVALLFEKVFPSSGIWNSVVTADSVGGAAGFCALVGIVFGLYPAYKASRLDPIVALRTE